jgi:hypothetical protein
MLRSQRAPRSLERTGLRVGEATGRPARENALSAVVGAGVTPGDAPAAALPDAPAPTRASRAPLAVVPVPALPDVAVAAATADGAR